MHVYSPKAGADNPLRTNVDVNRKPLLICPFVASFKTISLKYDFKHILNGFIHVLAPGQRQTTSLGQHFDVNRKPYHFAHSLQVQKKKSSFIHVYIPKAGADNPLRTNVDVNRKPLSIFPCVASFKTISLKYDFKHIVNDFI